MPRERDGPHLWACVFLSRGVDSSSPFLSPFVQAAACLPTTGNKRRTKKHGQKPLAQGGTLFLLSFAWPCVMFGGLWRVKGLPRCWAWKDLPMPRSRRPKIGRSDRSLRRPSVLRVSHALGAVPPRSPPPPRRCGDTRGGPCALCFLARGCAPLQSPAANPPRDPAERFARTAGRCSSHPCAHPPATPPTPTNHTDLHRPPTPPPPCLATSSRTART